MTILPDRPRKFLHAFFCAAALLAAHAASGATFEVTPVLLEMQGAQRVTSFTVVNREDHPTTIQVRGLAWQQDQGADSLMPTQDLQVSPPIFTLAANESQLVRVFTRKAPASGDASEHAYRILIDEIPAPGEQSAVRMALRISIPLFAYAGRAGTPMLEWNIVGEPGGGSWLTVSNKGSRRTRLLGVSVAGADNRRAEVAAAKSAYVLPGAQRAWRIDAWDDNAQPAGAVTVNAKTDSGEVNAQAVRAAGR